VRAAVGECLACTKLGTCRETNLERVLSGYTCILFKAVPEAVDRARAFMMSKHGERAAIRGMLDNSTPLEGEDDV
jgi:hypothetical protein